MRYEDLKTRPIPMANGGHWFSAMKSIHLSFWLIFLAMPKVGHGDDSLKLIYMPAFEKIVVSGSRGGLAKTPEGWDWSEYSSGSFNRSIDQPSDFWFQVVLLSENSYSDWSMSDWSDLNPRQQEADLGDFCRRVNHDGVVGYYLESAPGVPPQIVTYLYVRQPYVIEEKVLGVDVSFTFARKKLPHSVGSLYDAIENHFEEICDTVRSLVHAIKIPKSVPSVEATVASQKPLSESLPTEDAPAMPLTGDDQQQPGTSDGIQGAVGRGRVAVLGFSKELINDEATIFKKHPFLGRKRKYQDLIRNGVKKALERLFKGDYSTAFNQEVSYDFIESPSFSIGGANPHAREDKLGSICQAKKVDALAFGHFKEEFSPADNNLVVFLVARLFVCSQKEILTQRDKLEVTREDFRSQVAYLYSKIEGVGGPPPPPPSPGTGPSTNAFTYVTAVPGDTLSALLERCYGKTSPQMCDEMMNHNPEQLRNCDHLRPKMRLLFPARLAGNAMKDVKKCENARYEYIAPSGIGWAAIMSRCYGLREGATWQSLMRYNEFPESIREGAKLTLPHTIEGVELLPESQRKKCPLRPL